MGIKEFYLKFGRMYPLSVVQTAYGYTQMQHEPRPALATASAMYGAKFESRPLYYTGYKLVKNNSLTVYRLQTETLSALDRLTAADITKGKYTLAALFGENCRFENIAQFEPQSGSTLGAYLHRNRYVTIVRIQSEQSSENLQKTADLLAQDVMAAYTDYVYKTQCQQKSNTQEHPVALLTTLVGEQLEQFLHKPLYLLHQRDGYTSLNALIDSLNEQFNLPIKITEIYIFGL